MPAPDVLSIYDRDLERLEGGVTAGDYVLSPC